MHFAQIPYKLLDHSDFTQQENTQSIDDTLVLST